MASRKQVLLGIAWCALYGRAYWFAGRWINIISALYSYRQMVGVRQAIVIEIDLENIKNNV